MAFNLINFKKGTPAGLNTLKTNRNIEEGTFYLTIDENKETSRLYIGTSATTALPVNSNIAVVTETTDLTNAHANNFNDGDFAYVTNGNILAVRYNGSWTQINAPDSRAIKDLTPSVATSNGVATISWSLRDQDDHVIQTADATPVVPSVTMTGANGVSVSSSNREVTITGTAYEMHSPAVVTNSNTATVKLQSKNSATGSLSDVSSVTINGGSNVTITGTADNITIAAADTTLTSTSLSTANNATSGFDISIRDSDNHGNTATIDPKITLGTNTSDQYSFVNGVANLPVYTKEEIDNTLKASDAMTFKGTFGTASATKHTIQDISSSSPHIGDAYKVIVDTQLPQQYSDTGSAEELKAGDMIIAVGQETNGVIGANDLKFVVIPSGDDITIYKGLRGAGSAYDGNGIQIEDNSNTILASLEIAAGSQMAVSSTHTDHTLGDGAKAVVTVAHGLISTSTNGDANTPSGNATSANSQEAHHEKEFDVVTGLTTNNGHVTATEVTRIKVVDTVSQIDTTNSAVSVTTANNASTVKHTIALIDEDSTAINSKDLEFILQSQNLAVTSSGNTITMNYVWGTF